MIVGTKGINMGDGKGDYVATSIRETILRNLQSGSLAVYLAARSPYSGELMANGSIAYRIPHLTQSKAYEVGQVVNETPQIETQMVHVSDYRTQKYELESFDASMIENMGALEGQISANLSASIQADLDYHFLKAIEDYIRKHPDKNRYLPELSKRGVPTNEELQFLNNWIAVAQNDLCKTITNKYIGVGQSEFFGLVDRTALKNIRLLLTGLNASNSAYDMLLKGIGGDTMEKFEFNGLTLLVDNFINFSLPQGYSFNGDYSMNLKMLGYIIHREAVAFPIGLNTVVGVINPNNGNMRYIAKYCFGSGIIRPELLIGFTDLKTLTQLDEDAYEVVAGEKVKVQFFAEGRGTATNWTTSAGALFYETDDSCILDTAGVGAGTIIEVKGTAGALTQTTTYKVLAKV